MINDLLIDNNSLIQLLKSEIIDIGKPLSIASDSLILNKTLKEMYYIMTPKYRNKFLKTVISKVDYYKSKDSIMDNFNLEIYFK